LWFLWQVFQNLLGQIILPRALFKLQLEESDKKKKIKTNCYTAFLGKKKTKAPSWFIGEKDNKESFKNVFLKGRSPR
jgi:hypothetical protein